MPVMSNRAYREVLADYFRAHAGQWIDGLTLAGLAYLAATR